MLQRARQRNAVSDDFRSSSPVINKMFSKVISASSVVARVVLFVYLDFVLVANGSSHDFVPAPDVQPYERRVFERLPGMSHRARVP